MSRDEDLVAAAALARGPALNPREQLEWDLTHGVGDAEGLWRLVRFDAEHEWDRLENERELERLQRERQKRERQARGAAASSPAQAA